MTVQLRTLVRATFTGFFESELMPPGLPQVRLVIFAFVVVMFPATQLPLRAWQQYLAASRRTPEILDVLMWPHKLLFVTFAMVTTAVVALVIWDNVFPDRRDAFIIGHLPIRPRTIVGARLIALAGLMCLIALGSAAPSALFYGLVAGGYSDGGILRGVLAHFAATMGASIFAFLLLLALQGLLINLIPARWLQRAMVLLQFVFVVAALEALLFMPPIVHALERTMAPGSAMNSAWMTWAPPAWFLGLYEVLAGTRRPIDHLAIPAVAALTLLLPGAFGLYAFTFTRLMRRAVEARDADRVIHYRNPLVDWVPTVLTRSSIAEAVCRFAMVTVARSRKHRLLLTIFAGIGTTAAAASALVSISRGVRLVRTMTPEMVLPVGLVLIFFLVLGLRSLFAIPTEPSANWPFKLNDAADVRLHVRGASAALIGVGVLPVILLLAPLHVYALGAMRALGHSAVLLAAGLFLSEVVLRGFRRVPFTSAYSPPAARVRWMWPFWLAGYLIFSFTLSAIEGVLLHRFLPTAILVCALLLAADAVRRWREWDLGDAPQTLTFDEGEEDAPVTLELGGFLPTPGR